MMKWGLFYFISFFFLTWHALGQETRSSKNPNSKMTVPKAEIGQCPTLLSSWVDADYKDDNLLHFIKFESEAETCEAPVKFYQDAITRETGPDSSKLLNLYSKKFSDVINLNYKNILSGCSKLPGPQSVVAMTRFYSAGTKLESANSSVLDEVASIDSVLSDNELLGGIECPEIWPHIKQSCGEIRKAMQSCPISKEKKLESLVKKTQENIPLIQSLEKAQHDCVTHFMKDPGAMTVIANRNGHSVRGVSPATKKLLESCDAIGEIIELKKDEIPWVRGEDFMALATDDKNRFNNKVQEARIYDLSDATIKKGIEEQLKHNRRALVDSYKTNLDEFRCLTSNDLSDPTCKPATIRPHLIELRKFETKSFLPKDGSEKEAEAYFRAENCILERHNDRETTREIVKGAARDAGITIVTSGIGAVATLGVRGASVAGEVAATSVRATKITSKALKVRQAANALNVAQNTLFTTQGVMGAYAACTEKTQALISVSKNSNLAKENVCSDKNSGLDQATETQSACVVTALSNLPGVLPFVSAIPSVARFLKNLKIKPGENPSVLSQTNDETKLLAAPELNHINENKEVSRAPDTPKIKISRTSPARNKNKAQISRSVPQIETELEIAPKPQDINNLQTSKIDTATKKIVSDYSTYLFPNSEKAITAILKSGQKLGANASAEVYESFGGNRDVKITLDILPDDIPEEHLGKPLSKTATGHLETNTVPVSRISATIRDQNDIALICGDTYGSFTESHLIVGKGTSDSVGIHIHSPTQKGEATTFSSVFGQSKYFFGSNADPNMAKMLATAVSISKDLSPDSPIVFSLIDGKFIYTSGEWKTFTESALAESAAKNTSIKGAEDQLKAEYATKPITTVAQNKRYLTKETIKIDPDRKTYFIYSDNSVTKEKNDTWKDKVLVDAVTKLHMDIFFNKKLNSLLKEFPNVSLPATDFKSLSLAIRPGRSLKEMPADFRTKLQKLFDETNDEFSRYLKDRNIIDKDEKPELWIRAGGGETPDQAAWAARKAREQSSSNFILHFDAPEVQEALAHDFNDFQNLHYNVETLFRFTKVIEASPYSNQHYLSTKAFYLVKKGEAKTLEDLKDIAHYELPYNDLLSIAKGGDPHTVYIKSVLEKEFRTKLTKADVELLRKYVKSVDGFSPNLQVAESGGATLVKATHGGFSIDFSGQGAINLRATSEALRSSKDGVTAIKNARINEVFVTKDFKKRKEAVSDAIKRIQEKYGIKGIVKASGDDMVFIPKQALTEEQSQTFADSIASAIDPSSIRISFVGSAVKDGTMRAKLAAVGETYEKELRRLLQGKVSSGKLKKVLFSVSTDGSKPKLIISDRNKTKLTPTQIEKIQSIFTEVTE